MNKILFVALFGAASVFAATPNAEVAKYLSSLKAEAKTEFSEAAGKEIFTKENIKDGQKISCTSCHTQNLKGYGENKKTGKRIEPLAPSANPKSLTDVAEIKKWLKRNFNDVYGREGTAKEKGDVLTFLLKQ
jgi:cytochrome c peroxidase